MDPVTELRNRLLPRCEAVRRRFESRYTQYAFNVWASSGAEGAAFDLGVEAVFDKAHPDAANNVSLSIRLAGLPAAPVLDDARVDWGQGEDPDVRISLLDGPLPFGLEELGRLEHRFPILERTFAEALFAWEAHHVRLTTGMLPPWQPDDDGLGSVGELQREMAPVHVLRDVPIRGIATSLDEEDALFQLEDGTSRVACVHFTWNEETSPEWPVTVLYDDLDHWRRTGMLEDHAHWQERQARFPRVHYVRCAGPRLAAWRLAVFLWGTRAGVEMDTDARRVDSTTWRHLTLRESGSGEGVEVSIHEEQGWMEATSPEVSARTAWFLATTTGGTVNPHGTGGEYFSPAAIEDRVGAFDLEAALRGAVEA